MKMKFSAVLLTVVLLTGCLASRTHHLSKAEVPLEAYTLTKSAVLEKLKASSRAIKTLRIDNSIISAQKIVSRDVVVDYGKGSLLTYTGRILVERPSRLHMQIDASGFQGTDVVSDDKQYKVSIPFYNAFGIASITDPIQSDDFKCNLRPSLILDALFVDGEQYFEDKSVVTVFHEFNELQHSYYLIDLVRIEGGEPLEELWFDRYYQEVTRKIQYSKDGVRLSDVQYFNFQMVNSIPFPQKIVIDRPVDKYKLEMNIVTMSLNDPVDPIKLTLDRPPNADELDFKTCKAVKRP